MATHFNISGELTQQLLAPGDNVNVSKISLTNVQKVSECKVDLYIEKASTGKFYLIKGVELPIGATLIYDDIKFSNRTSEFGLYIKLTDGASFTLTGSIDVTGANTAVPGTDTLFTSELSVGDEVVVSGETRTISSITSDTAAVVSSAFGSDLANDTSPDCNPTALVDVIIN
jgi:hypothetical protein|tara:strand:+ start:452 stop:967 length:516 start_codon:yes stop_codon:yes gene_type:complete